MTILNATTTTTSDESIAGTTEAGTVETKTSDALPSTGGNGTPQFSPEQQEYINRIAAEARQQGRNSALRRQDPEPTKTQETTPQAKPAPTVAPSDEVAKLRAELEWRDIAAEQGLTRSQARRLASQYIADSPADPAAWVQSFRDDGLLPTQQTTTTTQEATVQPKPASAATQARKVSAVESDGLIDVFSLTAAEHDAMGPEEIVRHFERARNAAMAKTGAPRLPAALRRERK